MNTPKTQPTGSLRRMVRHRRRGQYPFPGYRFCAAPKCHGQVTHGWPNLCDRHRPNACDRCAGRGEHVLYHNEGTSRNRVF